jgi:hypothetical protein
MVWYYNHNNKIIIIIKIKWNNLWKYLIKLMSKNKILVGKLKWWNNLSNKIDYFIFKHLFAYFYCVKLWYFFSVYINKIL